MKKLAAAIALSAALVTPAAAQYYYDPGTGLYVTAQPRGFDEVYVYDAPTFYRSPTPLITPRGVMSDPDPHIRSQIQRNYNHYLNMNGG